MPICYVCESSLALPKGMATEECNLSIQEIIDEAKEASVTGRYVYTMNPFFLQALVLFADKQGVLNKWNFVLLHNDGTTEDKTEHREELFSMMSEPLDQLFMVTYED